MTSPYLNRPPRRLEDVLESHGMTYGDIGWPREKLPEHERASLRKTWMVTVCLILCLILGSAGLALITAQQHQKIADDIPTAEHLNDITPAAGPTQGVSQPETHPARVPRQSAPRARIDEN